MKIPKPTDDDKDYFRSLFDDRPEVAVKAMFGNLGAFVQVNDQMCAGLFGPTVGVRLGDDDRSALESVDGSGPFGPPDRPMREYVAMPDTWREDHDDEVARFVDAAIAHTSTLPPKKKRSK